MTAWTADLHLSLAQITLDRLASMKPSAPGYAGYAKYATETLIADLAKARHALDYASTPARKS